MSVLSFFSDALRVTRTTQLVEKVVTGINVLHNRAAQDVVAHSFVEQVGTDAVEALSTSSAIVATAHAALVGHLIRLTSGTYSGYVTSVAAVTANLITLGQDLPGDPTAADTFEILRFRHPVLNSSGGITVTATTVDEKAATAILSNVASSASSVTILAANSARLGATIFNDSTQVLYLKFGSTASATSYVVQMAASSYYEVPFDYTGIITGIWASANGNARVTELTA